MARRAKVSPHNLFCSFCKVEFFPTPATWSRWRNDKPAYCTRVCASAKQAAEAHARNPDQPCTTCGKLFKLSGSQRDKIKTRPGTGLYCSTECLYASRKTNPRKTMERKKGEKYFTARTCGQCHKEFVPSARQRQWGALNPKARSFCSTECDHEWRSAWMKKNILNFPRPTYRYGPDHSQWKHGLYSSAATEVYKLRTKINRYIKEGAKA